MRKKFKPMARQLSKMQEKLRSELNLDPRGNRKSDLAEIIGLAVKAEALLLSLAQMDDEI